MRFLKLRAYFRLIRFQRYLKRRGFELLYNTVRAWPKAQYANSTAIEDICYAVDMACIWYWKEVSCLSRSAVTASFLKQVGVPAELVFGAQQLPYRAHAWVEVDGKVVNDKPYMRELYTVVDHC